LSQQNEIPPADAAAYMNAARTSKLCYYVSTTGAPTGAQVQQGTDAWQNQQNAPGIDNWNDIVPTGTATLIPTIIPTTTLGRTEKATPA
jgi:hypothetical protein